jgi:pimeloyl-ACP methyl ester carboxylesterase
MKPLRSLSFLLACVGLLALALPARGAEPLEGFPAFRLPNLEVGTLGGKQFWCDELHFHRWRIQQNAFTGHCRLLDARDRRHAWGTLAACEEKLAQIRRDDALPAMKGKGVIVLHGLFRTSGSMGKLCTHLESTGEFTTFNVTYPSTQGDVAAHARALGRLVKRLEGIEEIHLVGHSLGNIVVRHYLADETDPATGRKPDPRIKRIVMLGPPNHGSPVADVAAGVHGVTWVAGESLEMLGPKWKELEPRLATPACEFGILAGGRGDGQGYNPLLPGDDDATVTVESARLEGARDFRRLPVIHSFLMEDKRVLDATLRFLKHGYFESEEKRQPIEKKEAGREE